MEISQFVSGFLDGDAISNYAVELQKIIQSWGYTSKIYGISRHVHSLIPNRCHGIEHYQSSPENIAIFHFSVGSEMTDFFKNLPEKKVLIYHNITPAEYFQSISEEKASVLREGRKQLIELAQVPDISLAVSAYNAQELADAGFHNARIFPLLLHLEDLNTPPHKKILNQFKKPALNILFVGRVAPNKKIEDVILGFYYVKKLLEPTARLFIVGSFSGMDQYLAYLRALTIELDLQEVFFTGHVTQYDLVAYYRLASVFLCMSEHEGFCIPLLEAMHFDIPIIAYNATGVPGTLNGAGVLVEQKNFPAIAEMIHKVYRDHDLKSHLIQKQRKRLSEFDHQKWADEFKKILEPLVQKKSSVVSHQSSATHHFIKQSEVSKAQNEGIKSLSNNHEIRNTKYERRSFKIAFVVPRYESGTAGGAEVHAAQLATRLAARGHKIEVFTTCAKDHHRWGNELQSGKEVIDDVQVHRFPTDLRGDIWLFLHLQRKMHLGLPLSSEEEAIWLKNNVHSQVLYDTIQKRLHDFDGIIFMPYLFGITYEGSKYAKEKFILIPCLHNEPYAKLRMTNDLFQRAQSIFFNTQPERELAQNLYGIEASKSSLVALGFDEPPVADTLHFRKKYGLENQPYFIFVGRWEKGKNVELLIQYFQKYLVHSRKKVKLILLGSGDIQISKAFQEDILPLGYIPLEDKLGAIAGAIALCQPSVNESLSIVIMEAWSLKTPILVHKNCAVTRYHSVQSSGGLYFENYFEFEEALNFFLSHEELRKKMGELGYQYVRENYSWEKVIDRFEKAFETYLSKP